MGKKAVIESVFKTAFGLIPYGGQLLNEVFFDYRSRIKQQRLNNFIEAVIAYLESKNVNAISLEIQQSEDFGDLFESIVRRVVQTSSEEKRIRFRNVLVGYVSNPTKLDYRDTYLDILEKVNETQIHILKAHSKIKDDFKNLITQRDGMSEEMSRLNDKLEYEKKLVEGGKPNNYFDYTKSILSISSSLKKVKQDINIYEDYRKADYYGIEKGEYLFLLQDLYSKGLLIDQGIGAIGTNAFEIMAITSFGKEFLKFINEG